MTTGRFREPMSSSSVSLMGSRRLASGVVPVLPLSPPPQVGFMSREGPRQRLAFSPCLSGLEGLAAGPGPWTRGGPWSVSCGQCFLSGDSWRDSHSPARR